MNANAIFDIAISFAGEQRAIAKQINDRLQQHRIRTFYDTDHTIDLWGKNLAEHLPTIYSDSARFVLIILSEEYLTKVWTTVERRAAVSKLIRSSQEYVLIYKIGNVDATSIPGISPDISYVSDKQADPGQVANGLLHKLGIKYTDDELFEIVEKEASGLIKTAHLEGTRNAWGGGIPFSAMRDALYEKHPGADARLGIYLMQFLNHLERAGVLCYFGGVVNRYALNGSGKLMGVTLDDVLAMDDTYSATQLIFSLLDEKAGNDPQRLSQSEHVLRSLTIIVHQINGGWLQWISNTDSSRLFRSVGDLREIGCVLLADLARQALAATGIDQHPQENDDQKHRLLAEITEESHAAIDVLDSQFRALSEDFMGIARVYVVNHRTTFDL